MGYLPYFAARQIALDMDRRGERPGLFLKLLVGIPSAALVLGGGALLAFTVADFGLWELGIIG